MRIRIKELEPYAYGIMEQFDKYLETTELSKTHRELIKIRASQLNNCGYCLNLHSKEALKNGENESRIFMLPLWKTVPMFYSEEEQVILQITEVHRSVFYVSQNLFYCCHNGCLQRKSKPLQTLQYLTASA